ncbi:membrane protein [Streptomyces sp. AS58]|uniref:NlpC/P60 domain-containing protein n=1 Tax=Streptomyces cadmiisoli TaxID=2184053 RepID=A0A2Z4J3F1_9ACTN|nr:MULTISPECIES: peptidoglycan-binding protein [Streptomyces]AWW39406.1 hypothetical protein DN051_24390 [Streptomyces cadmiisoli]KOV51793.1 membrane protein [Streptomyces sp. AS58]
MKTPVFEEFEPADDCDCPGCAPRRPALAVPSSFRDPARSAPGRPVGCRPGATRVLAVAALASAALAAGHATPVAAVPHAPHAPHRPGVPAGDEPDTPQGGTAPLHGPGGTPAKPAGAAPFPAITRAEIINRAKKWVADRVPYSMTDYWSDGYRQDCSGFVSMAWKLPANEWTGTLHLYGVRITKDELQPGDMLLFHNPANPQNGSHVVIFGGWTDQTRTHYTAYESIRPRARKQTTPYAYSKNSDRYVPYRYRGVVSDPGTVQQVGTQPGQEEEQGDVTAYPGTKYFGPGAVNEHVTQLGRMLIGRGAGRFYPEGPGPLWTDADRMATQAFQVAQGWKDKEADGLPGERTWDLLVTGKGKDIPPEPPARSPATAPPAALAPPAARVPAYPGRGMFRPGASNEHVLRLGQQLVRKGFGGHYATGPGTRWGDADRRSVEAFQRAQGWRGGAANGHPGPETWRRLFS